MVVLLIVIMLMAHLNWVVGAAGLNIVGLAEGIGSLQNFTDLIATTLEKNALDPVGADKILPPRATLASMQTYTPKRFEHPVVGESIQGRVHTETVYVTSTTTVRVFGIPRLTVPPEAKTKTLTVTTVVNELTQTTVDLTSSTPTFSTPPQPTPSVCGEYGDFMLNFDGLPAYSGGNDEISSAYPPIFNPYRHFFFSGGWGYLHERNSPVSPKSSPHVAIYEANENNSSDTGSPYAGLLAGGKFGAGPRAYDDAFWFNAKSFYIGCNNGSNDGRCTLTVTGAKYSSELKAEHPSFQKIFKIDACPDDEVCVLQQIEFPEAMEGLSSLGFKVTVLDSPVTWYIDDIQLRWFNNTCLAGMKRVSSR